jgi:hypothetical protein
LGRRCQELHSINATNKMKIDRLEEMEESFREITRLAGSAMRATTKAGEALPDDKVMVPKRDGWAEAQPPVLAATETQGPVIPVTDPGAETGRASLPIKHGGQEDETWTPEDYSRMLLRAEGSGDDGARSPTQNAAESSTGPAPGQATRVRWNSTGGRMICPLPASPATGSLAKVPTRGPTPAA